MKRVAMMVAVGLIGMALGAGLDSPPTYAASKSKVDCAAVMKERNSGKKAREVAKEMNISISSVYRCKQKEMAAKAASKAGNETPAKPATSTAAAAKP